MKNNLKLIDSSFLDVKKKLNPKNVYVIFEMDTLSFNENEFSKIIEPLMSIKERKSKVNLYRDKMKKKILIVISVASNEIKDLKERVFSLNLPKDITSYIFEKPIND